MRKQQLKLLEKAQKRGYSEVEINLLSRDDLTIRELEVIFHYLNCQSDVFDRNLRVNEAAKCVNYLKEHRKEIENSIHYMWLLNAFLPCCFDKPDPLLGNKKKLRIFKMYRFLVSCLKENEDLDWSLLDCYLYMLCYNFSTWHIKMLLRPMIADRTKRVYDLNWFFDEYPCLKDDYLCNGVDSLLYFLVAEKGIINDFRPNKQALMNLYDYEKHRFCLQKEAFDNFFVVEYRYGNPLYVIDKTYLAQRNLEMHPIIQQIVDFCKSNGLEPEECSKDIFTRWKTWRLNEPEKSERIKESYILLGQSFTTKIPAFYLSISISSNCFVTVDYREYDSIFVGADNKNGWKTAGYCSRWSFMISPDGRLFSKLGDSKKYIPFSIRSFLTLYRKQNIFGAFMNALLNYHKDKNIFYRDVICDCLNTRCLIPLNFNEVAEYHNRADLILKKYKTAVNIRINWNKQNINLSYLIIKAYNLVEPGKSREILLQQKDISLIADGEYSGHSRDYTYQFLGHVLYKKILKSETKMISDKKIEEIKEKYRSELADELHTDVLSDEYEKWIAERVESELHRDDIKRTAVDYISMCRQSKKKVSLDIRSAKKLYFLHDRIAANPNDYRKKTGKVKVPKNSRFNPLRDILPAEFEWIKTRKRLILETELQHHCVWSYADSITKDVCAIYSFTDSHAEHTKDGKPRRYTIEFRQNTNGTYYVQQVQGKYDSVNANGMKEYIQSLLLQR